MNLLKCHKVHLYHRPDEFYLIKMFGDVDGDLLCIRFKADRRGKGQVRMARLRLFEHAAALRVHRAPMGRLLASGDRTSPDAGEECG